MLDVAQVNEIGAAVARDQLPAGSVLDVASRGREGSDGEEMVIVLAVLRAGGAEMTGEDVVNMVYQLQPRPEAQGEDQSAVVERATEVALATGYGGS